MALIPNLSLETQELLPAPVEEPCLCKSEIRSTNIACQVTGRKGERGADDCGL